MPFWLGDTLKTHWGNPERDPALATGFRAPQALATREPGAAVPAFPRSQPPLKWSRPIGWHSYHHRMATCGEINGTSSGSRAAVESAVASNIGDVEVVKVNQHGSSFSSNTTYVSTLSAEAAIISVGKNSFGHPDPDVITRWDTHGTVFQTQSPIDNTLIDGNVKSLPMEQLGSKSSEPAQAYR